MLKWGILEEKTRDFGGKMGDFRRENALFTLKWGAFEEKLPDFGVKWEVFEEKMHDFHLNGGFLKRNGVIFT